MANASTNRRNRRYWGWIVTGGTASTPELPETASKLTLALKTAVIDGLTLDELDAARYRRQGNEARKRVAEREAAERAVVAGRARAATRALIRAQEAAEVAQAFAEADRILEAPSSSPR